MSGRVLNTLPTLLETDLLAVAPTGITASKNPKIYEWLISL